MVPNEESEPMWGNIRKRNKNIRYLANLLGGDLEKMLYAQTGEGDRTLRQVWGWQGHSGVRIRIERRARVERRGNINEESKNPTKTASFRRGVIVLVPPGVGIDQGLKSAEGTPVVRERGQKLYSYAVGDLHIAWG